MLEGGNPINFNPTSPRRLKVELRCAALFAIFLTSSAVFAAKPIIYPSTKHPDFPFSEAVAYRGVLYLSGEIGTDAEGKLVAGGIGPQTRQTMNNIKATLGNYQLDMSDLIKCTVFLADIAEGIQDTHLLRLKTVHFLEWPRLSDRSHK